MAKSSNTSSAPTTAHTAERKAPPSKVSVFNHTGHMIGVSISNRKAGTPGSGPEAYTVDFKPGNNSIDSAELEKCMAHPAWSDHVERRERRSLIGKKVKSVDLQVGLHDEEFEVESEELGKRMQQLHEKRVG